MALTKLQKIKYNILIFFLFLLIFTTLYKYFSNYTWRDALYIALSQQTFSGASIDNSAGRNIAIIQMISVFILITVGIINIL